MDESKTDKSQWTFVRPNYMRMNQYCSFYTKQNKDWVSLWTCELSYIVLIDEWMSFLRVYFHFNFLLISLKGTHAKAID